MKHVSTLLRLTEALLVAALLSVAAGCGQTCRLGVSNATESPIQSVSLSSTSGLLYRTDRIDPQSEGKYVPLDGPLPKIVRLAWTDKSGTSTHRTIKQKKPLPRAFRGRILFEIKRDGSAQLFVTPPEATDGGLIPWNFTESFDGTVNIPGLGNGSSL
jgi:hypothetical protein